MKTLYHYTLCPYCRKVRISLNEKKLNYTKILEKVWEKRPDFIKIESSLSVPVLVEDNDSRIVSGSIAIDEYLEAFYPETKLLGNTIDENIEVRKFVSFFDQRFYADVIKNLIFEKFLKKYFDKYSSPNSTSIREGKKNLIEHLEYIAWIVDTREWIAGNFFSLADIAAAAHISVLDYTDDIPWSKFPEIKAWYLKIKSRPSFQEILQDKVHSITPPPHYSVIDF